MSDNSSSSSISSLGSAASFCPNSTLFHAILVAYSITRAILVLPPYSMVLYLGVQRWRNQKAPESHSDIITYHLTLLEVVRVLGVASFFHGIFSAFLKTERVGSWLLMISMFGENLFHVLTCVERYLAVVHPHTYVGLRGVRGVRIRNLIVGCSWLLSFLFGFVSYLGISLQTDLSFSILTFSLASVSYCSISVLCVLVRPGPGDRRKYRERVDPAKHRAFLTIMAIWGVLWLWFSGILISFSVFDSKVMSYEASCVLVACSYWANLPSCLLLPLLYLQRAGKLSCCRHKNR